MTPPSGATSSICDQVPVEARLSADGVVFEGVAIDSMCLCLQNGRYTAESQAQLDSALSATSLVPRIDELCRDYYVALGRQYTDQDAQTCPPALIDSIQANTLHTVSLIRLIVHRLFNVASFSSSANVARLVFILPAISLQFAAEIVHSVRSFPLAVSRNQFFMPFSFGSLQSWICPMWRC